MTTDHHKDLDWLAFCYAAGDLDSADAEAFEARLADDQAAREALARAVELSQIVAAAETQTGDFATPAARTSLDWNRHLSWIAVGGLASLLIALLWSGFVGPTWHTAQNRLTAQSRYQLAMAWNKTRSEFSGINDAGLWLPLAGNDVDDEAATSEMAADDEAVADFPSWMTAAVFSMPRETESTNQSTETPANPRLENE
jgi:hypothetical protein